jgi:hypothetical protein
MSLKAQSYLNIPYHTLAYFSLPYCWKTLTLRDHAAMAESKPTSNWHTLVAVSPAQASIVEPYGLLTGGAIRAKAEPKTVRPWLSQSQLVTHIL